MGSLQMREADPIPNLPTFANPDRNANTLPHSDKYLYRNAHGYAFSDRDRTLN
jgi:hypothetical protein